MNKFKKIAIYSILLPVLFLQFSCDDTADDTSVGALVGTWELSALTGEAWNSIRGNAAWDRVSHHRGGSVAYQRVIYAP